MKDKMDKIVTLNRKMQRTIICQRWDQYREELPLWKRDKSIYYEDETTIKAKHAMDFEDRMKLYCISFNYDEKYDSFKKLGMTDPT